MEIQEKLDLNQYSTELFMQLIRECINCLVVSLCARNDAIYAKTLLKMNW